MKINAKILVVITFSINWILTGCEGCTCPPNVKLGDVKMLTPSFFSLKGGETLKYINSKKEIITLTDSSEKQIENQIIVESLCAKPPISNQFSYYSGTPSYNFRYVNTQENLRLEFSFRTLNTQQLPKDTVLYDYLNTGVSSMRKSTNLGILVSDRGNRKIIEPSRLKIFENIKMVDTTLNGRKYEHVFYNKTDKSILYAEKIGLISFIHKNERWYLLN